MIPVARPDVSGNESAYVTQAIESTWISSSGEFVDRFEVDFAEFCSARRSVTVSSGTAALHVVLAALNLGFDDEVIVPSLTFMATANAVQYQSASPVLVDVDPETWTIDVERLQSAIGPKTRGIIAVHLYGHPADMDPINATAREHGLWVVEDAAEAHGAKYKGKIAGSLAQAAAFSFYGNKIITSGVGGAVVTDDDRLADRVFFLKEHGMEPGHKYHHPVVGYNYQLSNVACAIACAQLERFEFFQSARAEIYAMYREQLDGINGIELQPTATWAEVAPWMFSITIDKDRFGMDRDALASGLAKRRIETRPFFVPLHQQPPYRESAVSNSLLFPVSERLGRSGISLPTFVGMSQHDVATVAQAIRDIGDEAPG